MSEARQAASRSVIAGRAKGRMVGAARLADKLSLDARLRKTRYIKTTTHKAEPVKFQQLFNSICLRLS